MEISVEDLEENEDGSLDVVIEYDEEYASLAQKEYPDLSEEEAVESLVLSSLKKKLNEKE